MNTTGHIAHRLHDYLDGELPVGEKQDIVQHLSICPACWNEYEELQALRASIEALPATMTPPRDLWSEIRTRIDALPSNTDSTFKSDRSADRSPRSSTSPLSRKAFSSMWLRWGIPVVLLAIGLGAYWLSGRQADQAWEVLALEGIPSVNETLLEDKGQLRVGQWLETDASSRASLDIGSIGQVEIAPKTRVQLRKAEEEDHRLSLAEGRIEAFIWAPPRLFFVETPSALAIDLGCAYTLEVDSTGTSLLHVTSGYVKLEHEGRESLVPAGAMCRAYPGKGPGTAFDQNASQALRDALMRYDFEDGGAEALTHVLTAAQATDAITLWQLLQQADERERGRIYDRLAELAPPPTGVTREDILNRDPATIDAWEFDLGLYVNMWEIIE